MDPPCQVVTKEILPHLKRELAKEMNHSGLSQGEISRKLGVSQAMVSKYLAEETVEQNGEIGEELDLLKTQLLGMLDTNQKKPDMILAICQSCFRLRESGRFCSVHPVSDCTACSKLRYSDLKEDKRKVVEEMLDAIDLLKGNDISILSPQVMFNLAQASASAENRMDVASIPGRLAFVNGRLRAPYQPEFGSSTHLSKLLLSLMEGDERIRAIMNIKLDEDVILAIGKLDLKSFDHDREMGDIFDAVKGGIKADVILDKGDFGIEPCTYVLGANAIDVVKKVIKIAREVNGKRT